MEERMIVIVDGKEYLVLYCGMNNKGQVIVAILMPLHNGRVEFLSVLMPQKIAYDTFVVQESFSTESFDEASQQCREWSLGV